MKKQVIVIGLGRFGLSVANSLSGSGNEVLAIDANEQKVQSASARLTHVVHGDATDESVLNELGARNFNIAVVAIGTDIQSSVLATILLKRLGVQYVIARANNTLHGEILRKIGADKVVFPEQEMGNLVSHEIRLGNVSEFFPVAAGYGITSIEVNDNLTGMSLTELGFGPKWKEGIAVLLVQRGKEVIVTPGMNEVLHNGDKLIISGREENLEDFLLKIAVKINKK